MDHTLVDVVKGPKKALLFLSKGRLLVNATMQE